ncbi:MAG: phage holin family protein [Thermoleophilaceae bacterium]
MVASPELSGRSVSELLQQASEQTAKLVRQEIRLAQAELQEKGKRAGIGAGMFGGAGLVAAYGIGAVIAGVIMLLATAIAPWLAGLIVGVVLLLGAGALALSGKKQVEQATPPKPERALDSVQRDVDEVKTRAQRA